MKRNAIAGLIIALGLGVFVRLLYPWGGSEALVVPSDPLDRALHCMAIFFPAAVAAQIEPSYNPGPGGFSWYENAGNSPAFGPIPQDSSAQVRYFNELTRRQNEIQAPVLKYFGITQTHLKQDDTETLRDAGRQVLGTEERRQTLRDHVEACRTFYQ